MVPVTNKKIHKLHTYVPTATQSAQEPEEVVTGQEVERSQRSF